MSFTSTWTPDSSPPPASMPSLAPSKYDWTKRRRSRSKPVRQQQQQHATPSHLQFLAASSVLVYLVIACCATTCTEALLLEPSISAVGGGGAGGPAPVNDDNLNFNMENKIAAIFSRVSYGSTTTKRSISDTGAQSSLTTIPTPFLTTYRYVHGRRW